jgi:hypothetical protein
MEIFKEFAQYGLLGLVLLFVGWGLWKIIAWLGANIVKPFMDRHVTLVDTTIETQKQIVELQERQTRAVESLVEKCPGMM